MRINLAVPEAHVSADVLDAALEATTRLNEHMLASGEMPTFERGLHHGVRWRPEPPGQGEHFDHGQLVTKRKWGDCDDLAPWHAASLRHTGEDPGAEAFVAKSGPSTWHAMVRRSDGTIDDPSKRAGMDGGVVGIIGATVPLMFHPAGTASVVGGGTYILRPQLALRPNRDRWQARTDIPWIWREHLADEKPSPTDYAMAILHTEPTAATALTGAIDGACNLALASGIGMDDHLDRLDAIAEAVEGATMRDLLTEYGPEHAAAAAQVVGSFWHSLLKAAHTAMPFASRAVQFVPGIGPVASAALDLAHENFPDLTQHSAAIQHGLPGHPALPGFGGGGLHFHCVPFG